MFLRALRHAWAVAHGVAARDDSAAEARWDLQHLTAPHVRRGSEGPGGSGALSSGYVRLCVWVHSTGCGVPAPALAAHHSVLKKTMTKSNVSFKFRLSPHPAIRQHARAEPLGLASRHDGTLDPGAWSLDTATPTAVARAPCLSRLWCRVGPTRVEVHVLVHPQLWCVQVKP